MLFRVKRIQGYQLKCSDGEIGKVKEFYFDDRHWTIRYLVLDTGHWLHTRKVLISPYSLTRISKMRETIGTSLSRAQIENSPCLDSDKPVSRQFETEYHGYYGYPEYWGGAAIWGYSPHILRDPENWYAREAPENHVDSHLRSTRDVIGHHIQANNGEIGHVDDFLLDDKNWAIRYLIVDTQNWLPGTKVLISPQWIESISWAASSVKVSLSRELIRNSPKYIRDSELTRNYESQIYHHYNRRGYWLGERESRSRGFTQKHISSNT